MKRVLTNNTAIHEAGHAVVGTLVGRRVEHISIVPNSDHVGHVKYAGRPKRNPSMEVVLGFMTSSLAGVAAERRAGLRPRRWTWQGDWETAMTGAAELSGGDAQQASLFFRIAERRACSIVDLRWQVICDVAEILDHRRTLTGDHLRAIVLPKPVFLRGLPDRLATATSPAASDL